MADSERISLEEYRRHMPTVEQVAGWSLEEAAAWLLDWARKFGVILVDHDGRLDWVTYPSQLWAPGFEGEVEALLSMVRAPGLLPHVVQLMRLAAGADEGSVAELLARHPGIPAGYLLRLVDSSDAVW